MDLLGTGNTAKVYCLNRIEEYIKQKNEPIRILDLGCGTAMSFVPLLKKYPDTQYVGIEPSKSACIAAERNLKGLSGTIINAPGYSVHQRLQQVFDVVVSFSALEHVYKRQAYLQSAKECLKNDGYFMINYDAGHFVLGTGRDKIKNIVGPLLAPLGIERYYQSFVREQEFRRIITALGLKIIDEKFFNTALKGVYKVVPDDARPDYMGKWLDLELWLNETSIHYDDRLARSFVTRNFILQC